MDTSDRSSRRRLVLIAAGSVTALVCGVGIYGLATGPHTPTSTSGTLPTITTGPSPSSTTPATASPSASGASSVPRVARSADPEQFARNVATTLFAWDTATGLLPLDYTSAVLAVGDPSGAEQAGLATDVAAYLPSRTAWQDLREYGTSQHLTIDRAYIPDQWGEAVAQAPEGQLAPGTVAYTIEGTRHRTGTWNGERVGSAHKVEFTVFVVCAPTYDTCHLLRLSQLDNPLR
ncbi:hypothetical protein [Helcobacillus massiliensis]|uniref:hypothetical protein n=1 Tax=Helcobacillus massiliensis TaxID=521392 RepID=UPI0016208115|nr:hypothetical protein [Helcobacillus massiliensis]